MPSAPSAQRGIQSMKVGGQLLRAPAHRGRPLALKDLAQEAGMARAKAHPCLVSFGKLGLIEQDPVSGRCGLGPLAIQLDLISLQQLDPVALATTVIEQLASHCRHMATVAVWGNRGATIVRIAQPPSPMHASMRHGTVMSLRGMALGLTIIGPSALLEAESGEARAARLRDGAFTLSARPGWRAQARRAAGEGWRRRAAAQDGFDLHKSVSAPRATWRAELS